MHSASSCQLLHARPCGHAWKRPSGTRRSLFPRQITTRGYRGEQTGHRRPSNRKSPSQIACAAGMTEWLLPLQDFSQEQLASGGASSASPEIVSMVSACLGVPLVVYGAVSVIQQIQQTNEDAVLKLKAMQTHNTFMRQKEVESAQSASRLILSSNSSSPSSSDSQSSSDEPDTAAPAMLDQPERPEPRQPQSPATSSTNEEQRDRAHSQVPPQTAVLDRPDRPEPDSAGSPSGSNPQSSIAAQQPQLQFSFAMSEAQSPVRPGSPETSQQAASLQAEYDVKIKTLKGAREPAPPMSRQQKRTSQVADPAVEYAAKLAQLHEESAARAEGDLHRRQQRYAMLADLQAQAQLSRPASPADTKPVQEERNRVLRLLAAFRATVVAILVRLFAPLQKLLRPRRQPEEVSANVQYGN